MKAFFAVSLLLAAVQAQDDVQEINCAEYHFPHETFSQTDMNKVYLAIDEIRDGPFRDVGLTKYTTVFGVRVIGHKSVPDEKLLHTANLLAQVMDNNQDGKVDHPKAQQQLMNRFASLIIVADDTYTNYLLSPEEGTGLPSELKFCPFAIDFEELSKIQTDDDSEALCEEFSFDKDRTLAFVTDHLVGRSWPFHLTADADQLADSPNYLRMMEFQARAVADGNFIVDKTGCPEDDLENCSMVMFASWAASSMLGVDRCFCEAVGAWRLCDSTDVRETYPELTMFLSEVIVETYPDGTYAPSDKEVLVLENADAPPISAV